MVDKVVSGNTQCRSSDGESVMRDVLISILKGQGTVDISEEDIQLLSRKLESAQGALNTMITVDEYREAKHRTHIGKAVGHDGIPFEVVRGEWVVSDTDRQLISPFDDLIVSMFNCVLSSGKYPEAWRLAILVPLLKGHSLDGSVPNNYRGIALLVCLSKLFANILEKRISDFQWVMGLVSDAQFGFTRERRTLDAAFILDTLIDQARASKKQLYAVFIDFQKAYDYVFRDGLFFKMVHSGMLGCVYRVIVSMYESVKSIVRLGSEVSDVIQQHVGLRQGCVLSPCLFSLFIADFPVRRM